MFSNVAYFCNVWTFLINVLFFVTCRIGTKEKWVWRISSFYLNTLQDAYKGKRDWRNPTHYYNTCIYIYIYIYTMCIRGWVGIWHERFENGVAFWVGIPVKVTQEAGVVPRCRRAAIETPFNRRILYAGKRLAYSTPRL